MSNNFFNHYSRNKEAVHNDLTSGDVSTPPIIISANGLLCKYDNGENFEENLPLLSHIRELSSVILDNFKDEAIMEDLYCDLNYKKLSGKKLTQEEKVLMSEIDRQLSQARSIFSDDPKYLKAKKEMKQHSNES